MSPMPMWGLALGGRESQSWAATLEGLSNDMQALFLSDSGDIVIKCENKQIKVHSFLIGARSPVFARMFQTGMKEQHDRVVELKDDAFDDIRRLLFYMYTGLFEDPLDVLTLDDYEKLKRLLIVADKYEVLKLVFYIGSEIALNEENALELGVLGDVYHSSILVRRCADFIHNNMEDCLSKEDSMRKIQESPKLMAEIIKLRRRDEVFPNISESSINEVYYIIKMGAIMYDVGMDRTEICITAKMRRDMTKEEVNEVLDLMSSEGQICSTIDQDHFLITNEYSKRDVSEY